MEVSDPSMNNLASSRLSNQENLNNFSAFKELKQTQQQYELIRNRIKILKMNDEKYRKKMENHQNKIEKLDKVRNQTQNDHQQINSMKKSRLENIEEQKNKNSGLKQSILANSQANLESLINKKVQIYEEVTKQSVLNQKKIQKIRQEHSQQKQAKYKAIVLEQQRSKQNIENFGIRKTKTIHEQQMKESTLLNKKKQKKRAEIDELEKIEMQMMKKYSQSHIAFKSVKNKLDQMLGKIQNKKTSEKIKEHANGKMQSFYAN